MNEETNDHLATHHAQSPVYSIRIPLVSVVVASIVGIRRLVQKAVYPFPYLS